MPSKAANQSTKGNYFTIIKERLATFFGGVDNGPHVF
jgi:hypothetical protein